MGEWLLVLLVTYGGGGSAQIVMERFGTELDCERAKTASTELALGGSGVRITGSCIKQEPRP